MTKKWIAIALGVNGGPSGGNTSGFVDTEGEAEIWAEKALNNANIHGVAIAKIHSKAQRVSSPIEFVQLAEEPAKKVFDHEDLPCFGSGIQSARV
jgi:hypothetical protein